VGQKQCPIVNVRSYVEHFKYFDFECSHELWYIQSQVPSQISSKFWNLETLSPEINVQLDLGRINCICILCLGRDGQVLLVLIVLEPLQ
jgi:hypothetical protein